LETAEHDATHMQQVATMYQATTDAAMANTETAEADRATLAEALRQSEADAATMRSVLDQVETVVSESHGVDGWHLNGALATWGEVGLDPQVHDALTPDVGKALLAQMAAMREALELLAKGANITAAAGVEEIGCARCLAPYPAHEPWCEVGLALAPNAGAHTLAKLARLDRIEVAAQAWQAAWDAAEAFQRHEHTWADGTRDYSDGLWQTETERALDLKATLEAK
jgi:hypothetical protein